MNIEKKKILIEVARGIKPCDLLIENAKLINVLTGEIYETSIAVFDGKFIGFGSDREYQTKIDVQGAFLAPSFIDGHMHIESTMLTPSALADAIVPHGTTAIVADPHEIANVCGIEGIKFMLDNSKNLPYDAFFMIPSCVPATPFETSGSVITSDDIAQLIKLPRALGLAELMNYPGVIFGDDEVLRKIKAADGCKIDGHCPGLTGNDLSAYLIAGAQTDHETTNAAEALEKLRQGLVLAVREGTAAKNLEELSKICDTEKSSRIMFVTDDMHPYDLKNKGHINSVVAKAIKLGIKVTDAFRVACLTASEHYNIEPRRGAVAVGYSADFIVFDSLENIKPQLVYKRGVIIAKDCKLCEKITQSTDTTKLTNTVHLKPEQIPDLSIKIADNQSASVLSVKPGEIVTEASTLKPASENGFIVSDLTNDVLKLVVVERHTGKAGFALGLVKGWTLQKGAIASSIAHDAHNLIAVGANDDDIKFALKRLIELQGGCVVVENKKVLAEIKLEIGGLMTSQPFETVASQTLELVQQAQNLGCNIADPFITLAFLSLSPIPALKLTDKGLFDSINFKFTPLLSP